MDASGRVRLTALFLSTYDGQMEGNTAVSGCSCAWQRRLSLLGDAAKHLNNQPHSCVSFIVTVFVHFVI